MTKRRRTSDPNPVDPTRVQRIINAAQLRAFRLLHVRAHAIEAAFDGQDTDAQATFGTSLRSRFERDGVHGAIFVATVFLKGGQPAPPQALLPVDIEVHRILVYSDIPPDATNEELEAFGAANALFHAWPFLRADVFQLSSDFGLAPIVLPLLRLNPASGEPSVAATEKPLRGASKAAKGKKRVAARARSRKRA